MTRSRHVVIFGVDNDILGGAPRVLHMLAQGLASRDHQVSLIGVLPAERRFVYFEKPLYDRLTLYPSRPLNLEGTPQLSMRRAVEELWRHPRRNARARALMRSQLPSDGYMIVASPSAVTWVLKDRPPLRIIGQYHQSYQQAVRTPWHLRSIRATYPTLDKSIFLSSADAAAFAEQGLPNTGHIPNPLSFFPGTPSAVMTPRVLAAGEFLAIKRYDRLLRAFAAALPDVPDAWELHLCGDGPEEPRLRALAGSLGIADRVVFPGRVADMETAYLGSSIVALSSAYEGKPLALAEAAACGVPSVAFDVSAGVRSLVRHGETGLLVPQGDVSAFTSSLVALMNDPDLRRKMGAAARPHVEDLRLEKVLDRWEALFDEIDR